MLGFDQRAARFAWTTSLVVVALYLAYSVRHTAFIFVLALFFAYMLYPLVKRIAGLAPLRWSKSAATAIVYVLLMAVLAGGAAAVGPLIVEQATALTERLPKLTDGGSVLDKLPLPDWLASYRSRVVECRETLAALTPLASLATRYANGVWSLGKPPAMRTAAARLRYEVPSVLGLPTGRSHAAFVC